MEKQMAESERKDLEAHVDLCAERYKTLHKKLDKLDDRLTGVEEHIIYVRAKLSEFKTMGEAASNESNKTLIGVMTAVGAALLAGLIATIVQLTIK
jgi:predicted  nucleic acid-binding Zn-ribbon protein